MHRSIYCIYFSLFFRKIIFTNSFNIHPEPHEVSPSSQSDSFGFSVAASSRRLFVGAPRHNTTNEAGENVRGHGVVWGCSLSDSGSNCQLVDLMTTAKPSCFAGIVRINVDQNLGASVFVSRDEDVIGACAPRFSVQSKIMWEIAGESDSRNANRDVYRREPIGKCVATSKTNVKYEMFPGILYDGFPCFPSRTGADRDPYYKNFAGIGVTGVAAHFSAESLKLFVGSPGAFYLRGRVDVATVDFEFYDAKAAVSYPKQLKQTEIERGATYPGSSDSYLGSAITVVRDKSRVGSVVLAVGAPKDNGGRGGVNLIEFVNNSTSGNLLETLKGAQLGSYFGSAVAAVDVNGDGIDDVLVGAPLFRALRAAEGPSAEIGCVEAFLSRADGTFEAAGRVTPPEWVFSRFGSSLANLGDINGDGFGDVVVGAPFPAASSSSTLGAIFIYGGGVKGLGSEPLQRIQAAAASPAFGHALAIAPDFDGNGFEDVVVGDFSAGKAFVFWSAPAARIERVNLQVNKGKAIDLESAGGGACSATGMAASSLPAVLELCIVFKIEENPSAIADYLADIQVFLRFDVRRFGANGIRAFSADGAAAQEVSTLRRQVVKAGDDCLDLGVVCFDSKMSDKVAPIVVDAGVGIELAQKTPRKMGWPAPRLAENQRRFNVTTLVKTKKDCGADNFCRPDLKLTVNWTTFEEMSLASPSLKPLVHFLGGDSRLHLRLVNDEDDAFETKLLVDATSGATLDLGATRHDCECETATKCACAAGNPLTSRDEPVVVELSVGTEVGVAPDSFQLRIGNQFLSGDADNLKETWKGDDITVLVKAKTELKVTQATASLTLTEDDPSMSFYVKSLGPTLVHRVAIDAILPRVLFLDDGVDHTGTGGGCQANVTEGEVPALADVHGEGSNATHFSIDCREGESKLCVKVECSFVFNSNEDEIVIKFPVGVSAAFDDAFPFWRGIAVHSIVDASVVEIAYVDPVDPTSFRSFPSTPVTRTGAFFSVARFAVKAEKATIWILVASAAAALALLVIIVVVLWRIGFFKRKKMAEAGGKTSDGEEEEESESAL